MITTEKMINDIVNIGERDNMIFLTIAKNE
jgi:hypothetical protein